MTPEEKAAHDALLAQMKETAKTEIETRGYQNKDAVTSIINQQLEGLPLEALRGYETEKTKFETTIRNLAGEVEKIQKRASVAAETRTNAIMEAMDKGKQWEKVELAMRTKNPGEVVRLNVRAAAVMTLSNTIDETTNSIPDDLVESLSIAEFVPKRRGDQFIFEIADRTVVAETTEYKSWLEEGTEEGSFAIVAEGATKPLVSTGLVRNFSQVKKIAGKYVVTEEFAKFRKNAYNIIKRLITDKLVRDYSALLVTALNAEAAAYTGTSMDDTVVAPTDFDAIGAVAAQIETLNFSPDVLIIHPQDKWRLALSVDGEGRYYMLVPAMGADGITRMMGFRVVTSTYQTLGYGTLGEAGMFKIEEEPITVRMGYGVTVTGASPVTGVVSDFDNNQFRVIVETFFHSWIATPNVGSFVRFQFSTVKAALLKP